MNPFELDFLFPSQSRERWFPTTARRIARRQLDSDLVQPDTNARTNQKENRREFGFMRMAGCLVPKITALHKQNPRMSEAKLDSCNAHTADRTSTIEHRSIEKRIPNLREDLTGVIIAPCNHEIAAGSFFLCFFVLVRPRWFMRWSGRNFFPRCSAAQFTRRLW